MNKIIYFTYILAFALIGLSPSSLNAQTNVYDDIIAASPDHTYLTAAIAQQGLEDALRDPNAELTVFAPTDAAIEALAAALGTDISGILALSNLTDVLTYHVLGARVMSGDVTNGAIVQPLSMTNTIKMTVTSGGDVFANQAIVTAVDLDSDNGVVHVLDQVILPVETVVDVALDNGFTTLATAVVTAELLPALTDPLADFTVFAPSNDAFDALAAALGTDINGLLSLPFLRDVLTYHVLGSRVMSGDVTNGAIVQPLSPINTIKMTVTSGGDVFANQSNVVAVDVESDNGVVHVLEEVILPVETVVDVALDNGFTSLATAVVTAELLPALTNPLADMTVFAPTNDAFDALATALGTDINGLLALPNLADVLTYHVLGSRVMSGDVTNGAIVQPLSTTNTIKMTVTSGGDVFANQSNVVAVDVEADNGVVHVLEEVILPVETVVDVALDNGFTSLATAVVTAELLPALTNPLADMTVFAPTNDAFDALATALGTDINGLLALPNLADVLTYHVLGSRVMSGDVTNGAIVQPLSTTNTIKMTVTSDGNVFANQSNIVAVDVESDNGVVHVLDQVILPVETVVDIALDNGFTTLATAVVTAELLPALTNPLADMTVFAPTNEAFDALATALGTDIDGLLALPNLADVLTYHVIGARYLSTDLTAGDVQAINGKNLRIEVSPEVTVNGIRVALADVESDNGVVHVIGEVLVPQTVSTQDVLDGAIGIFPNPASEFLTVDISEEIIDARVYSTTGQLHGLQQISPSRKQFSISHLPTGLYTLSIMTESNQVLTASFIKNN